MPVDRDKLARLVTEKYNAKEGGIGMADFERQIGFSRTYFHTFVRGHRERIYLDQLEAIADALDVPLTDLLTGETRSSDWRKGYVAGARDALGDVHTALNGIMEAGFDPDQGDQR